MSRAIQNEAGALMTSTAAPTLERYFTLDAVRGVAVMGILIMNIVGMGMPDAAYFNPRAFGGATGVDLWVYLVNFVAFDGKMRGLFSFLFGASMLLVIERASAKGENVALVHYSRMFWLLVFGLAHLFLIWWGDILNHYAIMGAIAFAFRRAKIRTLIIVGIVLLIVQLAVMAALTGFVVMAEGAVARGGASADMVKALQGFDDSFGDSTPERMRSEVALHLGPYWELVTERFKRMAVMPVAGVFQFGWETLAYMLFGMAALRSGMLTAGWTNARYLRWVLIGFGIGVPVDVALAWYMVDQDFSTSSVVIAAMLGSTPVRPLMIVGWACLLVMLMRNGGWLAERIAATGRMAFTNYLMTSILMTSFFYGYGLGYFGALSRSELYLVVAGMWLLMLLWSKPWLARFKYGPLEWLWRSLSRGRPQPIAGAAAA